jgi:hypothetical protein
LRIVTEVMVNGPDDVYVERVGRLERAPDGLFEGEESVRHLMGRCGGAPRCALTRTRGGPQAGGGAVRRDLSMPGPRVPFIRRS